MTLSLGFLPAKLCFLTVGAAHAQTLRTVTLVFTYQSQQPYNRQDLSESRQPL